MTASAKQRAVEILWIVGAAALSLIFVSVSIRFSSEVLGVELDELVETSIAVLAAIGGGAWGVQSYRKKDD